MLFQPAAAPRAITPEGVVGTLVSPDSQLLIVRGADGQPTLFDLKEGRMKALAGLLPGESVTRWDASGRALYVYRNGDVPLTIFRLDPVTGRRSSSLQITPGDPIGSPGNVLLTPDGRSSVYDVRRRLSDLDLVTGLK